MLIDQGWIEAEQRDGKVFVTVGSGGAFPSVLQILQMKYCSNNRSNSTVGDEPYSTIKVTTHTMCQYLMANSEIIGT